ncbi:MAG TPA: alpha/beta family hydrolase [Egibacteraceae bacterium]|nr:alpha/beta family hydrolase [Egibacteraceae bacterium]
MNETPVRIPAAAAQLEGDLTVPDAASGIVVFAHGSGSSRRSPRNRQVAAALNEAGLATLLFDLLTSAEDEVDLQTRELRFDIALLAERLVAATEWLVAQAATRGLRVGYFGASTGAAAALVAAARIPDQVGPIVSRGGRPDLAGDSLERVNSPVLLIVGGADAQVLELNRQAAARLPGEVDLQIVPGAGHLFEEPGALEEVARLAGEFFTRRFPPNG